MRGRNIGRERRKEGRVRESVREEGRVKEGNRKKRRKETRKK